MTEPSEDRSMISTRKALSFLSTDFKGIMRMLIIILCFLLAVVASAQPLPSPFIVVEADPGSTIRDARITVRDNAVADIFYLQSFGLSDNHAFHSVVSIPDRLTVGSDDLPACSRWNLTIGDVASRGSDGWIALLYETSTPCCTIDTNRTRLVWGGDAVVSSQVLDVGYMPFVHPQSGDHTNASLSLRPRQSGGWLASWIDKGVWSNGSWSEENNYARVMTFDQNIAMNMDQFFGRDAGFHGPYWIRTISWTSDSALTLLEGIDAPQMNWLPHYGDIPYPFATEGSFYPLDFRRTYGGRLIACTDESRIIELHPDGTFDSLGITGFSRDSLSLAWNPDFGYAFLDSYHGVIMLARVDTMGYSAQPPGVFYDGGSRTIIDFSSAAITPNGRVVVLWGEHAAVDTVCTTLKIAWVDWTTYLDVNDQVSIQHPSSFTLVAYPNPFNTEAHLSYELPYAGIIKLQVFDILGRDVAQLAYGQQLAGWHRISWNASDFTSGRYFARLSTPNGERTIKLLLVK